MNWSTQEGQKKIGEAVAQVLRDRAPARVTMTYLLTYAMKELPQDGGDSDFMAAYTAVQEYITTNTGTGKPLSYKDGLAGGYALKPSRAKRSSKRPKRNGKAKRTSTKKTSRKR